MASLNFTPEQQRAVETIDRSVVVSAAAGSGKTAVLAARCVYLVADAPPDQRCDVDRLLVLTFTDAAAAEMRSRIVARLQDAAAARPDDERLRTQTLLVDGAHISTLHAFCLWMCRRWFSELGIDPHAPLLDEEEARVLRREVLDDLFEQLYDPQRDPEILLTQDVATADDPLRAGFAQLVDDYGLGRDREVGALVTDLREYVASLPEPEEWLTAACAAVSDDAERTLLALVEALRDELVRQVDHLERLERKLDALPPVIGAYRGPVVDYAENVRGWLRTLEFGLKGNESALRAFDEVCAAVASYRFPRTPTVRLVRDAPPELRAARDTGKDLLIHVRDKLFRRKLRDDLAIFSSTQWREGLTRIAPYVHTLVELVRRYAEAYERRKRRLDVLDFGDLERLALHLLCDGGDVERPSDIARRLRQRFAHVLVDEFQDINPIQRAIVELISREGQPETSGNLFVVGDVKQSIYRFRLGEPELFVQRWEEFRAKDGGAGALALSRNFRSQPRVLEAVNRVFRELMRPGRGTIGYDEEAELRHGRTEVASAAPAPVELQVIERRVADGDDEHDEHDDHDEQPEERSALTDPMRWNAMEREAFVIARRIRKMIDGQTVRPGGGPLTYRDCVVLLRAARAAAEPMVRILNLFGIPAHAEAGASLFDAREVRDVLAALEVLDNRRQDIPLASVLRSGIFGESFTADDLVAIRGLRGDEPFHACVLDYADHGSNAILRARLSALLNRIDGYRHDIRCRPLAQTLWDLYERHGFLAHVSGLPNGAQRRANLFKLHELAGRFGSFRRQGLHRFLLFLSSLQEQERDLPSASPLGGAEDVVRIMTVHQSKGLEFPVVFVAGLGNRFNFRESAGRMIFERNTHIGLRLVDPQRRREFPSAAHRLVAGEHARRAREEEMRILYVAMTRAREQLVLVGSRAHLPKALARWTGTPAGESLDTWELLGATCALDWLAPIMMSALDAQALEMGQTRSGAAGVQVTVHAAGQVARWSAPQADLSIDKSVLAAVAACAPLPAGAPRSADDPQVAEVMSRLNFTYRGLALSAMPAVLGASELGPAWDELGGKGRGDEPRARRDTRPEVPHDSRISTEAAKRRGIATHRVLQYLNFNRATGSDGLSAELERLAVQRVLTREELGQVDAEALAWFTGTPLAQEIRARETELRREFPFMARESPRWVDPTAGVALHGDDYVLVRGVVDGILPGADAVEIIDYKTDHVTEESLPARVAQYRAQMLVYSRAVKRLWRKPVSKVWLVFLTARRLVEVDPRAWPSEQEA